MPSPEPQIDPRGSEIPLPLWDPWREVWASPGRLARANLSQLARTPFTRRTEARSVTTVEGNDSARGVDSRLAESPVSSAALGIPSLPSWDGAQLTVAF